MYVTKNETILTMKKIKSLFVAILFIIIGTTSFSQDKISANDLTKDWTLLHSENGVEMYIKYGECTMGNIAEAFEYGFIKIVNTNSSERTLIYNIETYYADGCVGCDTHEDEYMTIVLQPNSTIIGACDTGHTLLLKNPLQSQYVDFTYLVLTAFKTN